MTCSVGLVERLAVQPDIQWIKDYETNMPQIFSLPSLSNDDSTVVNISLSLSPLMFSDRGDYICKTSVNITTNYFTNFVNFALSVQSESLVS